MKWSWIFGQPDSLAKFRGGVHDDETTSVHGGIHLNPLSDFLGPPQNTMKTSVFYKSLMGMAGKPVL